MILLNGIDVSLLWYVVHYGSVDFQNERTVNVAATVGTKVWNCVKDSEKLPILIRNFQNKDSCSGKLTNKRRAWRLAIVLVKDYLKVNCSMAPELKLTLSIICEQKVKNQSEMERNRQADCKRRFFLSSGSRRLPTPPTLVPSQNLKSVNFCFVLFCWCSF